jgi:hypothetical protein
MTVLEAIKSFPLVDALPDSNFILVKCTDRGINPNTTYTQTNQSSVELVVADVYKRMIAMYDFSESDLSQTFNRDALLKSANDLYIKNGEPESVTGQPKIYNRTNLW